MQIKKTRRPAHWYIKETNEKNEQPNGYSKARINIIKSQIKTVKRYITPPTYFSLEEVSYHAWRLHIKIRVTHQTPSQKQSNNRKE